MKTITLIFTALWSLSSCALKSKETVYVYGTPAFNAKIQELSYAIDEAAEYCTQYLKQQPDFPDSLWIRLDILYGDHYIFKTKPYYYNMKLAEYTLSGIWVNGRTGEIKEVEKGGKVRVILEPQKHVPFVYKVGPIPTTDTLYDETVAETSPRTTDCTPISGDMMTGEECVEKNTTLAQVYTSIVAKQLVVDTEYLQRELPLSDQMDNGLKNGSLHVKYHITPDSVSIAMLYDGGVTSIELVHKSNNVVRRIIYSAD